MADEGVVLLTGAASGIGRSAAEALAAKGRALALVDRDAGGVAAVAESCRERTAAAGYVCDVTEAAAVEAVCGRVREELGPVSVLVNCAGVGRFAPFLETGLEEWERMLRVNVMGAVHCIRAVLPGMLAAGSGLIVNVGSRMALDPHPTTTAYAASKGALHALSKALAMEMKAQGIKVTYLAPGGTHTNIETPKQEGYLEPRAVAEAIVYVIEAGGNAWVRDLVVLPLGF